MATASRTATVVALVSAMLMMFAIPSHALAGAGYSTNTRGAAQRVVGTGTWASAGGSQLTVAFECQVTATGDVISSSIRPPSQGGCVFKRNGAIIASAPGRTLPGAAAATASTASFTLAGTDSVEVCWSVYASFSDGTPLDTADCTDVSLLDLPPLGDVIGQGRQ